MQYPIASGTVPLGTGDRPPTSGTPGEYSSGNPGTGTLPTVLAAADQNQVVIEMCNAIVASGQTLSGAVLTQLTAAIRALPHGRQLGAPIVLTGSGTYTPSAGTNAIKVLMGGGGGGGGGVAATGGSTAAGGSGGGSGAEAEAYLSTGFSGLAYSVGTGGAGVSGSNGAVGTATTFGTYTAPGGHGGVGGAPTAAGFTNAGSGGASPTGPSFVWLRGGTPGGNGQVASSTSVVAGQGGGLGCGDSPTSSSAGHAATGSVAGGGGAVATASSAAQAGGQGGAGYLIIFELS